MKPKLQLEYYSKLYPAAWQQVDQIRTARGQELPPWPDWCFMPLSGAFAIVNAEAEAQGIDVFGCAGYPLLNDVSIIGALAAWRVTQGIYRFDPDIYRVVINTPITGGLPYDILYNLPEWCVYIETPGLNINGHELTGFFAYLGYEANDNHSELWLVLDYDVPIPSLYTVPIQLGPGLLADALAKTAHEAAWQADILGVKDIAPAVDQQQDDYIPMVSLLLYLCSANGDRQRGQKADQAAPKQTPKGPRLNPSMQPKIWNVGVSMGDRK